MAWGSDTAATQLTSITSEQFFVFGGSSKVSLNPGESAVVQVSGDFPTTPTDNLRISVYSTLDASSEVWDITPWLQFDLDRLTDPNRVSFEVSGVYAFRVGVKRTGTTDTITSADASYRVNGISV